MFQTIPAIIDASGNVTLLEPIELQGSRQALVTILLNEPNEDRMETALLSEPALADWNRPEEDAAWSYLQSEK
jgi:hypothetical protein